MGGYIKLYRDLQDNPLWQERPFTRAQAWIDMMFRCNHKCVRMGPQYQNVFVKRGAFLWSNIKLGEVWGWDEKKVRRFMDYLQKNEMISYISYNKFCVYEVSNYAEYQALDTEVFELVTRRTNAEQKPNKRRTDAEQTPTNNNDNNDNNEKKDIYTPEFENFFSVYPRQGPKQDTFNSWKRLLKSGVTVEHIMQCTQNYINYLNGDTEYAYGSNNFLGRKAYYKDFEQPKQPGKKADNKFSKPSNMSNYEERQYEEGYFDDLFKKTSKMMRGQ